MMDPIDLAHSITRQAYNIAADRYHSLFRDELKEKKYDMMLLDFFTGRLNKGSLICDAGCGPSGHIGRYLANKGMVITGIDISDRGFWDTGLDEVETLLQETRDLALSMKKIRGK